MSKAIPSKGLGASHLNSHSGPEMPLSEDKRAWRSGQILTGEELTAVGRRVRWGRKLNLTCVEVPGHFKGRMREEGGWVKWGSGQSG